MNVRPTTLIVISCVISLVSFAQNASIHGKVTGNNGQPVSSLSIILVNTRWGTITGDNGEYRLTNIKPGTYTIQLSFTGNIRKEESITIAAGSNAAFNYTIEQAATQLEEVIVETNKIMNRAGATANKMILTPMETPQIVHSISSVVLRKQNAMTLEDAMKNTPGVTKLWDATSRPNGGSIFVSRGFNTATKLRNGLPTIVNTNMEMANIERIEVLKGPSATMFGSIVTSYGGLINRVTKKPFFTNGGSADISYGSYNFYRASADYNFVLQPNKMAARINMAGQNQDSWQDAGFQRSYIIAPSFLYKPNDKLTISFDAEIVGSKGNSNGGNFTFVLSPSMVNGPLSQLIGSYVGRIPGFNQQQYQEVIRRMPKTFKDAFGTNRIDELKTDYDRSFLNDDLYATTQSNSFFADASYKISKHWTSQTAIIYNNSNNSGYNTYQYLIPNYPAQFLKNFMAGNPDFGAPGHDSIGRMAWNPEGTTNTFNVQQNFISDYTFGTIRNRAVIGLDYARYESDLVYNRFSGKLLGQVDFPDLFDVVSINGQSPKMPNFTKANVQQAFATRATEPFGKPEKNNSYAAYVNNVTSLTDYLILSAGLRLDHFENITDDFEETSLSPKFGLIIMPLKDKLTLFANYQNGFKNPSGRDITGKAFVPERAYQTEFGVKYSLFNNKLTGSVSYYDILAKNVQRLDRRNPSFYTQQGDQKSKGVELEILANPIIGWTILLGYGYNDSKLRNADAEENGLRPTASGAENTANFWTNYSFTKTALKGFSVGVSLNYGGESNALNTHSEGALVLPSYAIIGAHLSYDYKRYRLSLKANNITDKEYWMGWSNYIPQMRRQFIGTIAVKF